MKYLILLLSIIAIGCASTPAEEPEPCSSLLCMREEQQQQWAKQCKHHLFRYTVYSKREKEWVRREYPYPLTSSDSYQAWTMAGGTAPSPHQFCQNMAKAVIR